MTILLCFEMTIRKPEGRYVGHTFFECSQMTRDSIKAALDEIAKQFRIDNPSYRYDEPVIRSVTKLDD